MSIAHLQKRLDGVSSAAQAQDGLEAAQGGSAARLRKASALIKARKSTPKEPVKTNQELSRTPVFAVKPKSVTAAEKQALANEQVSAEEQSSAVALKGAHRQSLAKNKHLFAALTCKQPGFLDLHLRSLVDSVTLKTKPKALVDVVFCKRSIQERAVLKFVLTEIGIDDSEALGLTQEALQSLESFRSALYQRHSRFIEETKLAFEAGASSVGKLSLKQSIKTFQLIPGDRKMSGVGVADFLKLIISSPGKNLKAKLTDHREKLLALVNKETGGPSGTVANHRQYLLRSKLNTTTSLIDSVDVLEKINKLCDLKEKEEVNNEMMLLAIVEILTEGKVSAVRSIKVMFESLSNRTKQIYIVNVKRFLSFRPIFDQRAQEKNYAQINSVFNELLTDSYFRRDDVINTQPV